MFSIVIKQLTCLKFHLWLTFLGVFLGIIAAFVRVETTQTHLLPATLYGDSSGTWATGPLVSVTPAATSGKVWLTLAPATLYPPEGPRTVPILSLNAPLSRLKSLGITSSSTFPDSSSQIPDTSRGIAAQILLFGPEGKRFAGDRNDHWHFHFTNHQNPRGYVRGALESTYIPEACKAKIAASSSQSGDPWKESCAKHSILSSISNWLKTTRTHIIEATKHRASGALSALLVGAEGTVPYNLYDAYRTSGLLHLLVISGMQMSIVAGGVFLFIRWGVLYLPRVGPWFALRIPLKAVAAIAAMLAVGAYALLVGPQVSVVRALIMVALGLAALAFGRTHDMFRLWALTFSALILLFPEWLLRPGFQLSFAAVGGLLLWGIARGEGAFQSWPQKIRGMFESTLVASLSTAPILAAHFGAIPLAGILANLIAIPLMTLATWLGFIALLLWPLGGQNLALVPMEKLVATTNQLAYSASGWPYATIRLGQPPAYMPFSSKNRDEPQGGVSRITTHQGTYYMAWPETNPRTLRAFQRRWGIPKIEAR